MTSSECRVGVAHNTSTMKRHEKPSSRNHSRRGSKQSELTSMKLAAFTRAAGGEICVMAKDSWSGRMERLMRAAGSIIRPMAEENSLSQEVASMMGHGSMESHRDMEFSPISREPNTKGSGLWINSMDMELKVGKMEPNIKVTTRTVKRKVSVNTLMAKEATMKVTGAKTRLVGLVIKSGAMAISTKVSGKRMQCGAMVFSEYQTNQLTMDSLSMTKSMATASISGKMGENLRVGGITGSNMV